MPENNGSTFLIQTQNFCAGCEKEIFTFGGSWRHRSLQTPRYCGEGFIGSARPKYEMGSPEHIKALKKVGRI